MKTAADILNEKNRDILSVSSDALIMDALKIMVKNKIGAIIVKDENEIVGIWTERDLMNDALNEEFSPRTAKIKDYMTTKLLSAPHTASIYQLNDLFLGRRLRHLLIEKDGVFIGVISTGDVIKATLQEKSDELQSLNAIYHWEYYEDWKWRIKK